MIATLEVDFLVMFVAWKLDAAMIKASKLIQFYVFLGNANPKFMLEAQFYICCNHFHYYCNGKLVTFIFHLDFTLADFSK